VYRKAATVSAVVVGDPTLTEEKARARSAEIEKLIAEKKYELVKVIDGDLGRVYIYRFVLSDGSVVTPGCGWPLDYPRSEADVLQEVQNQIDEGKGELVAIVESNGTRRFEYKYILVDGFVKRLPREVPYLGIEEAVWHEVKQLIEEGKGELKWGPRAGRYCYKFILSNGKPMLYFTDKPLGTE